MPGTKNRSNQPPSNARVRRAAHRERRLRDHRFPSPERQARLHPSRADRRQERWDSLSELGKRMFKSMQVELDAGAGHDAEPTIAHPLPWRATDQKAPSEGRDNKGWIVLDADGAVAEYAKSRDKARARAKEVNGGS